jgi:hypothetical protein
MRALVIAAVVGGSLFAAIPVAAQTPPPSPDGWVVLPVEEYRALRERSLGVAPPPAASPVDATLTRVDYELSANGVGTIAGRALLTIDVLRDGWVRIPVPPGLMVRTATIDGQPVALVEDKPAHLLISRPGRSQVALDLVVPVTSAAGSESIALPASAAPITRASLVLPRSGVDLTVGGGFVADRAEAASESRWTLFGRPNEALTMTWKRRIDDRRAELPLRYRARLAQFVGLGEDAAQILGSVRLEIVQGLAQDVAVAVPTDLVINQVTGPTVADWQVANGMLRVRLLEPASAESSFVVQGEAKLPREGTAAVPLLRVPGAERESGGIGVDVLGAGEISGLQVRGLEAAPPSELGDVIAARESPSMIAFRLRPLAGGEPRGLTVGVVRYTPQAVLVANIEEARYRLLAAEDGQLLVEARYAVRNNQRSFLKVSLPEGATVWSADVAGVAIRPGRAEGDAILLPLDKGRSGQEAPTFVVTLVYLQRSDAWPGKGTTAIALPALDLPTSRTGVRLHFPPRFRVELRPGSFRSATDTGSWTEGLRSADRLRPPPPPAPVAAPDPGSAGLQSLVDRFRQEARERTVIGSLPVSVPFPEFGPSVFFAAELTAEARSPVVDLTVRRLRD